jgi:hypothetical protein
MDKPEMKSLTKATLPEISVEELEPRLEMAILSISQLPNQNGTIVSDNDCTGCYQANNCSWQIIG